MFPPESERQRFTDRGPRFHLCLSRIEHARVSLNKQGSSLPECMDPLVEIPDGLHLDPNSFGVRFANITFHLLLADPLLSIKLTKLCTSELQVPPLVEDCSSLFQAESRLLSKSQWTDYFVDNVLGQPRGVGGFARAPASSSHLANIEAAIFGG